MSEIGIPEDRLTPLPAGTTPDLPPPQPSWPAVFAGVWLLAEPVRSEQRPLHLLGRCLVERSHKL